MATKEQMREEFTYFGEAWNFFKRFYEVREDDAYWNAVVQQAGEILKQHDSPLCKAVMLAIIDELEGRYREMRKMPQNDT